MENKSKSVNYINNMQDKILNDTTGEYSEKEKKFAKKVKDMNFTDEDAENAKKLVKGIIFFLIGLIIGLITYKVF